MAPPSDADAEHPDTEPVTLLLSSLPSILNVSSAEERALLLAPGDLSTPPHSSFPKNEYDDIYSNSTVIRSAI